MSLVCLWWLQGCLREMRAGLRNWKFKVHHHISLFFFFFNFLGLSGFADVYAAHFPLPQLCFCPVLPLMFSWLWTCLSLFSWLLFPDFPEISLSPRHSPGQGSFFGNSSGLLQSCAGNGRQSCPNPSPLPWGLLCLPQNCISAVKSCSRSPLQNYLFVLKSRAFVQGL